MKQVKLKFNMKRTKAYLFLDNLADTGSGYLYRKFGDCYCYQYIFAYKIEDFDPYMSDHQVFRTFGDMVGNILDTVSPRYYDVYEFSTLREVKKFINPKAMAKELLK